MKAPSPSDPADRGFLTRYAWLSLGAAGFTFALKLAAYFLTGSVGLLSDAFETTVNIVGASMALAMLTIAARPADEEHAYGHSKAEYFSSGVEGTLILVAAVGIGYAAVERMITPRPLEKLSLGLGLSVVAALINLVVALFLSAAGKRHNSITLDANARHLMTDVWTSGGVVVGVGAVALTGWEKLDPLVAFLVAGNIIWSGVQIVRRSVLGLMDTALPPGEQEKLRNVLAPYVEKGIQYHALRTRVAGARRFVSLHILVPGEWTVHEGHHLLERIEADIRRALPNITPETHLESLDDPSSWQDVNLDRTG